MARGLWLSYEISLSTSLINCDLFASRAGMHKPHPKGAGFKRKGACSKGKGDIHVAPYSRTQTQMMIIAYSIASTEVRCIKR